MPTYDYRCQTCGFEFEKMQAISAEPLKTCPECDGKVERVFRQGGGFIMKGSSSAAPAHEPCCGQAEHCENAKRCCEKE